MDFNDLTFVLQGNMRPESGHCIRAIRGLFPDSKMVLSTWKKEPILKEWDLCDHVVLIPEIPSFDGSESAKNLPRQILSTQGGLNKVETNFVVKIRSDLILQEQFKLYLKSVKPGILYAWRNFTAEPRKTGLLFHLSDLLLVADTRTLKKYWDQPFDSNLASNLLPEQYLFWSFVASESGYSLEDGCKCSFEQIRRHVKAMKKFVRILPKNVAVLPERLQKHDNSFQRDKNYTNATSEVLLLELAFIARKCKRFLKL